MAEFLMIMGSVFCMLILVGACLGVAWFYADYSDKGENIQSLERRVNSIQYEMAIAAARKKGKKL